MTRRPRPPEPAAAELEELDAPPARVYASGPKCPRCRYEIPARVLPRELCLVCDPPPLPARVTR